MTSPANHLQIDDREFNNELLPALQEWCEELDSRQVSKLLWFIFGSVVKKDPSDDSAAALMPLLAPLGIRPNRQFRPESDIDIGLIVPDDHKKIDLYQSNPDSVFRTTRVAGRALSLTRFDHSWATRRYEGGVEALRTGTPTLGIFGKIVPIEI